MYSVIVTNPEGCANWSEGFPIGVVSVDENSDYEFEVYPNPTRGFLNLVTPYELGNEYIIELYDASGRKMLNEQSNNATQNYLDVSMLSQGVYHLNVIYTEGAIWNETVIIK